MIARKLTLFLSVVALFFVISTACDSSENRQSSNSTVFDIVVNDGKLVGVVDTLRIKKNEEVTLNFAADSEITVHLHGYDIEKTVPVASTTAIEFKANATGRFVVTTHQAKPGHHADHNSHSSHLDIPADAEAHAALFESETLITGDTYLFVVPADFIETNIPYHDHMSHDSVGQIEVSAHHGVGGKVSVAVRDGENQFYPEIVTVKPGASIEWIIESEEKIRLTSGLPPSSHGDHSNHSGEESSEKILITLEVYP